jgi:hypothetical protein
MLTYQQPSDSAARNASVGAKNDDPEATALHALDTRWHQIRISPIHEELKLFTLAEIKFFFEPPAARSKIVNGLYIDVPSLPKAIEPIAAILAFQWGMLVSHQTPAIYAKLLKNPIDLLTAKQQADKFSAIYLAHFDYDIQKVADYLNTVSTLPPCYQSTEAGALRAKKIIKTYKKALDIKHQHEKKKVTQQMIPLSYSHYALTVDISETNLS